MKKRGLASLVVRNRPGNRFFLTDSVGIIRGWRNKLTGEEVIAGGIPDELNEIAFSGIHMVNPEIFNYMRDGIYTMTSLYLELASDQRIYTFRHDEGFWADMGSLESLEIARKYYSGNY
jgi:NDP-sugar pyrophosphorylase family protein